MSSGSASSPLPAAGWYPDPLDGAVERLWDGERWTGQTRPAGSGSIPPPLPARRPVVAGPSSDEPRRTRSGAGLSTGSIVGVGCGLLALLSVGGCVVLVGVVPLIAVRSQDGFVEETEIAVAVEEPTTMVPMTVGPEPMQEFPPTTAGPGLAPFGSSAEMVAVLGNGEAASFEVAVEEPVDLTAPIAAATGPELEPGDDRVLVGVAATIVLHESAVEPLSNTGLFEWTTVGGATGTSYDPVVAASVGCDLIDADMTTVEEFGIGVERRGVVCFLVESADFEHPETRVVLEVLGGTPITWFR